MTEYKINFKNEFYQYYAPILRLVLCLIAMIGLFYFVKGKQTVFDFFLPLSLIIFLIYFIIISVVYLKYYKLNHKDIFTYNYNSKNYTFTNSIEKIAFKSSDIKKVYWRKFLPYNGYSIPFIWNRFYYLEIYLNSGRKITIGSLIFGKSQNPIFQISENIETFFPYPNETESIR